MVVIDLVDPSPVASDIQADGGAAIAIQVDLTQADAAERCVTAALDAYGDLHVVVNNAGVLRDRMSFNLSREEWESSLAVNLSASFYVAREAICHWRQRWKEGERVPRAIVNTSSESGLYGNAGQTNYVAAKAGIAAVTRTLATEVDKYGIRVNAIAPRARTPMADDLAWELPSDASFDPFAPEHVAEVVAWLASDAAEDVTGQVLVTYGGVVEVMETWSVRRRLSRRGRWTDAELLGLRDALFGDGESRALAEPIARLFAWPPLQEEAAR